MSSYRDLGQREHHGWKNRATYRAWIWLRCNHENFQFLKDIWEDESRSDWILHARNRVVADRMALDDIGANRISSIHWNDLHDRFGEDEH